MKLRPGAGGATGETHLNGVMHQASAPGAPGKQASPSNAFFRNALNTSLYIKGGAPGALGATHFSPVRTFVVEYTDRNDVVHTAEITGRGLTWQVPRSVQKDGETAEQCLDRCYAAGRWFRGGGGVDGLELKTEGVTP